jgi:hypothetical protein
MIRTPKARIDDKWTEKEDRNKAAWSLYIQVYTLCHIA